MWVFYLISLPLTMGMVMLTLRYFAGPDIPRYVLFTVGYTWFSSLSFIILVPADIWAAMSYQEIGGVSFFWSWSYWSTFLLTWAVVPILQGYEDAGDFTVTERLKTSLHVNLLFYVIVGSVALFGLILLILLHHNWSGGIIGFAMACSNTFGLVTGAFLLGFGLSQIPKGIWINADHITRQKVLSHKVARAALKLDDAHQNLSNAIVVAQATSKQMSKRDPLRPYMNIIDKMLSNMLNEDPSFKPQGGRLGENDMDYDTDEKSMAVLRRQLRRAKGEYYRCKSEYMNFVMEALELEDTLKNYERRDATGWKYISSFRAERSGKIGSFLDTIELVWRCILRKQLKKLSAIILSCLTVAILLAEATILPSGVDFSLFSILINAVQTNGVLVQVLGFIPLMYMCVCTYYSLFKIGRLTFYSLTPSQTSSVSLLMICSQVARYAPPISYNFLNLIRLPQDATTVFERRMGKIDDAVPFFGENFNKIYPLIMVVYTIMVASNFFDRIMSYFGNWKIFKLRNEADDDDLDGFDSSGLMILQKERSSIVKGHKVGELVIPLARYFNDTATDIESGSSSVVAADPRPTLSIEDGKSGFIERPHDITNKYKALKMDQTLARTSSDVYTDTDPNMGNGQPSKISLTWASMKTNLQNLRSNLAAKKFMPLRQSQDTRESQVSTSESLDEIFARLKQRSREDEDLDGFFWCRIEIPSAPFWRLVSPPMVMDIEMHDGEGDGDDYVELKKTLTDFLTEFCSDQLQSILASSDERLHYPLFAELMEHDSPLAHEILFEPTKYLPVFDDAAKSAQEMVYRQVNKVESHKEGLERPLLSEKEFVHVQIEIRGPVLGDPDYCPSIGRVCVKHHGVLLTFQGTVIRSGAVIMIEGEREYECRKCKHRLLFTRQFLFNQL